MRATLKLRYQLEALGARNGREFFRLTDSVCGLRVNVAPFAGADISSFQTRHDGGWLEWFHRADDFSARAGWRGKAPWLWPAVGRGYAPKILAHALRTGKHPADCSFEHDGKIYPLPIHGFVMDKEWRMVGSSADDDGAVVECELGDDAKTRRLYPFGFSLRLTTRVAKGALSVQLRVDAAKKNPAPMPFCVGNHITVRAPLTGRGRFEDVRVFSPAESVYGVTPLGLAGNIAKLNLREGLPLSDRRMHSMITGPYPPDAVWVRLVDPSGWEMEITQKELAVEGKMKAPTDAFNFIFWSLPQKKFFCPEPWLGLPNSVNTKRGAVLLRAGESFAWEMTIRVSQSAGPK